jgi:(2Fe-2S) ferredoxin
MKRKKLVLICTSQCPNQVGESGCHARGGEDVLRGFQEKVSQSEAQSNQIEVRESPCLNNCRNGVSVKVFPGNILYNEVQADDLHEILEGMNEGKSVKRLTSDRVNRFMGF